MRRLCVTLVACLVVAGVLSIGATAQENVAPCAARIENASLELLLQVRVPDGVDPPPQTIAGTAAVIAARAAALSPDGCSVRIDRDGNIVVALAGVDGTLLGAIGLVEASDIATRTLTQPGVLEIIDPRGQFLAEGATVETTLGAAGPATPAGGPVYETIIANADIAGARSSIDPMGNPMVEFTLTAPAAERFFAHTGANIGQPLSIVLDKRVLSSPVVQGPISDQGVIQGMLTIAAVEALAIALNTAPLPLPVTVIRAVDLASPAAEPTALAGVETFAYECCVHSSNPVAYAENPPVGGIHHRVWQTCGFYDAPVRNEHAVHSLEHGAVWITHDPNLPADQIDALRALAGRHPYLLVSPYPGLPAPLVASAWNAQLKLDTTADPRLVAFIDRFIEAGPERGATCAGGTSDTLSPTPTP